MELLELVTNMWQIVKAGWVVILVFAVMALAAGAIGSMWNRHA